MASHAVFGLKFRELIVALSILWLLLVASRRWLVAFNAFHLLVLAFDFKRGLLVIEFFAFLKSFRRVTAHARPTREFLAEHILMLVGMALFTEAAVLPFKHEGMTLPRWLRRQGDVTWLVTLLAILADVLMGPGKLEARLIMIEL